MAYNRKPKFGKPRTVPGGRSIPLRNPRRIDWHRWDENSNTIVSLKPKLREGLSAESFAGRPVKYEEPVYYHRLARRTNDETVIFNFFWSVRDCYFVIQYTAIKKQHTSRRYPATTSEERQVLFKLPIREILWTGSSELE